ncbi:unnamed protein product [Didymodactylos carnosus]|uniref:Uncharacterized protein n=1 Tax=Didymodactylos carnosus TaxID=1234261 RepID=A0A815DZA5_9BILA|nr:unnamed protein product [Didymodactylos carnosus]CAF1317534.1 unnamed protein product [Didymodactylos carnosus]CAF4126771.1 unnamed protein product [Didymodactylos carnosus]CAF4134033.1 unnamed protein product [Didymodactylos carnosus]
MPTEAATSNVDSNSVVEYNPKLHKAPFSVIALCITTVLGTYFSSVTLIELSLSSYCQQHQQPELYSQYLNFKRNAPIWKYWQILTLCILPIRAFVITRDVLQCLTRKANGRRHLLDFINFVQFYTLLYTTRMKVLPLETELINSKIPSFQTVEQLTLLYSILLVLNITGWLLPFFRYSNWKSDPVFHPSIIKIKKIE